MRQTTDLPSLRDSLKYLLECNLVADQDALAVTAGNDLITVVTTCPFKDGDTILIYEPGENAQAYARQIIVKPDNQLKLSEAIPADMPTARVQKTLDGKTLKGIYVGDPPTIPAFPAITISGDVTTEPYAMGGTYKATYSIIFSVYADGPDYDTANRTAWAYAHAIEEILTYRPAYQRTDIPGIHEDHQVNKDSTLKVVHLLYTLEEMIQRYAAEMPVNLELS